MRLFPKRNKPQKRGLVFSGGVLGAAFHAGACKAIKELEIPIDYVVGTSSGAIAASLFTSDRVDELVEVWRNVKRKNVIRIQFRSLFKLLYFAPSISSNEPLRKFLEEHGDHEAFVNSRIHCDIITLDTGAGREAVFSNRDPENQEDPKRYIKAIRASAALPLLFSQEKIGERYYWDGAALNYLPVRNAIEFGCDSIIAIYLETDLEEEPREYGTVPATTGRLGRIMRELQPAKAYLARLNEGTNPQLILVHQSVKDLPGINVAPFRPKYFKHIPETIEKGYRVTKEKLTQAIESKVLKI